MAFLEQPLSASIGHKTPAWV